MVEFLHGVAVAVLLVTAAGMAVMVRSGAVADQMMAVQLLGTGGVAVLLLLAVAEGDGAILDVALLLALLAAVAAAAFRSATARGGAEGGEAP